MIKVLIAEDEMLVRIGLKNSVDWQKFGMRVVADVSNGQLAWEAVQRERPDLVLTDIKMPVMDGIELITKMKDNGARAKFVILTAHEEFGLVRKALQLGVKDYILKLKMSIEEIEQLLERLGKEIDAEAGSGSDAGAVYTENAVVRKQSLMKDFLFSGRYSETEFAALAAKLNVRVRPERIVMAVMAIGKYERIETKLKDRHGSLVRFTVLNILDEVIGDSGQGEAFHEKDERYILVFGFEEEADDRRIYETVEEKIGQMRQVIKTYLGSTPVFGVSSIGRDYASMGRLYRECASLLEPLYFSGNESIVRQGNEAPQSTADRCRSQLRSMLAELGGADGRYRREMASDIDWLDGVREIKKDQIESLLIKWIHWPILHLEGYRSGADARALACVRRIHGCATLEDAIETFVSYLDELMREYSDAPRLSREIAEAVSYMERHYSEAITLQQVAEIVFMSPNYFSSLFKKELHISFVEYLNGIRIERAKELLVQTFIKSYEVAERVGYADESYFGRMFKKATGMSPNAYRRRCVVHAQAHRHTDAEEVR
ncbi:response regulator [Cohnella soli]|uniref:Response regulator n=1 Tax=Cohnella soli TaxID=425005 RepID=A0ABW0HNB3_9BACL